MTMIETLYKTKTPAAAAWIDHCFELSLGEQTVNGQLGYFVRETHCWWDAAAKREVRVQYTLSPKGGYGTPEEAYIRYELQRTNRAQRGFVHSFTPRYEATRGCKYARVEIPVWTTSDEAQGGGESGEDCRSDGAE
jgi:hypothetical protein